MDNIEIREALSDDKDFISNLMENTLNPFYEDDHKEKAIKLLKDHISSSSSNFGLFTTEQKIFIILKNNTLIGMVDLVRKKQNTFKISPIIIIENERNKGFGTKLYKYVEDYVLKLNGRQIYCTVSEDSINTINFFYKHNFVTVGKLSDYYKNKKLEFLLCKDFGYINSVTHNCNFSIQIIENLSNEVADKQIQVFFENIIGFSDNTLKEKLIKNIGNKNDVYVAITKEEKIVGFSVLSKKKSGIIKILPIFYTENLAFESMISFIEKQFKHTNYKKMYIQTFSTPNEIFYLQSAKWAIEALLPNSYKSDTLSLLWAKNLY